MARRRRELYEARSHAQIVAGLIGGAEGRLDPKKMIAKMVEVIPASDGNYRNVFPAFIEEALKKHQAEMFTLRI